MSAHEKRADGAQTLDITLLGRSYRVSCRDDERDALLKAVAYLEIKMNDIKDAGQVAGTERIAVMAALNVAHELLTVRLGGGVDMGTAKRRLSELESRLDEAIAKQEKLL